MEQEGFKEKLTVFLYALQGELSKRGVYARVDVFEHPDNVNNRYKFMKGVAIRTQNQEQTFEIWCTHKGECCWDYFMQGVY